MALIYAFRDATGRWHGEPDARIDWRKPGVATLTFSPPPGDPAADSPFAGQLLEVRFASMEGNPGPIAYEVNGGKRYFPTCAVHALLAGHRPSPSPSKGPPRQRDGGPVPTPTAARSLTMNLPASGQTFELSITPAAAGQVRVELVAYDRAGGRQAHLEGEIAQADLPLVGRIFFGAAEALASQREPHPQKAHQIPVLRQGPWTAEETRLLTTRFHAGADAEELGRELGRTPRAVRFKLHDLNLAPFPAEASPATSTQPPATAPQPPAYRMEELRQAHTNSHRRWTPEEDARLRARVAQHATVEQLMVEFGRNRNAITSRLARLATTPNGSA